MTINSNFQLPTTISANKILPTYESFGAIFFETPQYPSSKNFNLFDPLQTVCPFHHLIGGVYLYSYPFPPLFFPLPTSQFFGLWSCAVVFHQIWVFDKRQNDNRKKTLFQTALQVWRLWSTWAAAPTVRQSVTTSMQQLVFQTSGGQRMSTFKRSAQ